MKITNEYKRVETQEIDLNLLSCLRYQTVSEQFNPQARMAIANSEHVVNHPTSEYEFIVELTDNDITIIAEPPSGSFIELDFLNESKDA